MVQVGVVSENEKVCVLGLQDGIRTGAVDGSTPAQGHGVGSGAEPEGALFHDIELACLPIQGSGLLAGGVAVLEFTAVTGQGSAQNTLPGGSDFLETDNVGLVVCQIGFHTGGTLGNRIGGGVLTATDVKAHIAEVVNVICVDHCGTALTAQDQTAVVVAHHRAYIGLTGNSGVDDLEELHRTLLQIAH